MIVEFEGFYICDVPRRPQTDVEFWSEYHEWMHEFAKDDDCRPVMTGQQDIFFMDYNAAVMYMLRWSGGKG